MACKVRMRASSPESLDPISRWRQEWYVIHPLTIENAPTSMKPPLAGVHTNNSSLFQFTYDYGNMLKVLRLILLSIQSSMRPALVMRCKALGFKSACFFLSCLVLWVGSTLTRCEPTQVQHGSSYIFKGPLAEDKVIVMAHTKDENVDWVGEELQESVEL